MDAAWLNAYVTRNPKRNGWFQIVRDSTDPVYKERFLFSLEPEELLNKTLHFQVCDDQRYDATVDGMYIDNLM